MSNRPKLNMVDDPVTRRPTEPPEIPPAAPASRQRLATAPAAATETADTSPTAARLPADTAPEPVKRSVPEGYAQEPKKAVFGRVPRSLSRRLERAVLELREHHDDLTQEQVLAALLEKYVQPADSNSLTALEQTVNDYRGRL